MPPVAPEQEMTPAEIREYELDHDSVLTYDHTPREPTLTDAKFFFVIFECMDGAPDVDWDEVAEIMEYPDGLSARTRFGQIRRKIRDHYGVDPEPTIPKIDGFPYHKIAGTPSKFRVRTTNPDPERIVRRKASKPRGPKNAIKGPSEFSQNHGQGYVINKQTAFESAWIQHANERNYYHYENEYQNAEEIMLHTYPGYDEESNVLTVSDQGSDADEPENEDDQVPKRNNLKNLFV